MKNLVKSLLNSSKFSCVKADKKLLEDVNFIFNDFVNKLDLNQFWTPNKFIDLEIKKSILRSLMRYSKESIYLGLSLRSNAATFLSPPYPMIHLPNDSSETGGYHIDQVNSGQFVSIWIPIVNYNYPALSYIKNGYLKYIVKKVSGIEFNAVENLINAKYNFVYSWNGYFFHKGNKNTSSNISAALVIKHTKKPLIFEPVLSDYDISKSQKFNDDEIVFIEKYMINLYLFTLENSNRSFDKGLYMDVIEFLFKDSDNLVFKMDNKFNKIISFSLSLLAQRIENFYYKEESIKINYDLLHLLSLLFGSENLISLKKLISLQHFNDFSEALFSISKNYSAYGTYQWNETLNIKESTNNIKVWS
jgi:hypothetical protein